MLIISDKFGRLGNNIYQLLNILLEAEERNDNVNLQQLYHLNHLYYKYIIYFYNIKLTI